MYFKIIEIYDVMKYSIRGIKDWEKLKSEVKFGSIQSRAYNKYVLIDLETAETFGLESDISTKEFFDEMTYYDKEELHPNKINNCIILKFRTLKDKRIPEFASELTHCRKSSHAFRIIGD